MHQILVRDESGRWHTLGPVLTDDELVDLDRRVEQAWLDGKEVHVLSAENLYRLRSAIIRAVKDPSSIEPQSTIEQRRRSLEDGTGGDHDVPYRFMTSSNPVDWMRLLARVRANEIGGDNDGAEA